MNPFKDYEKFIETRTLETLNKAWQHSEKVIDNVAKTINDFFIKNKLDKSKVCFIAVGSIGRKEALSASDLDLIPILASPDYLKKFEFYDKKLRRYVASKLKIKVSAGSDLTKATSIDKLTDLKGIGGDDDTSSLLTKRILILTEGIHIYGDFDINSVKKRILDSYSNNETTRGKHILTLCNDLARYYRTLCIEYKAKIDVTNKDWGTRNAKLRHSRKVWYFATLLSMIHSSKTHYYNIEEFKKELLEYLNKPPLIRLLKSVNENQYLNVGKLLNYYSWFLSYMSFNKNRKHLTTIKYSTRYTNINGDFYKVKMNSDMVHRYICYIINDLQPSSKQKIIDWFLL